MLIATLRADAMAVENKVAINTYLKKIEEDKKAALVADKTIHDNEKATLTKIDEKA